VSAMTNPAPEERAARQASKTTAAASLPGSWATIRTPDRSLQTRSCSIAAAR